jgi:hypothetical protein
MAREFLDRPRDRWGFIRSGDRQTVNLAIFLHGFRGGYLDTWGKLSDFLFKWSDNNSILQNWDFLFVGYDTAAIRTYIDIAEVILTQWRGACAGLVPFGRPYERLALLGHSLGTLGIRQLLCSSALWRRSKLTTAQIHHVVLYGTPLNGSSLANFAGLFRFTDILTRSPKNSVPNLLSGYEIRHALSPNNGQLLMLKLWTESAHMDGRLPPISIVYGLDDKVVGTTSPELVNWAGDEPALFSNDDHLGLSKLATPAEWENSFFFDSLQRALTICR